MNTISQTALEAALLDRFHQLYQAEGFPPADLITVLQRRNTGGGRYIDIEYGSQVQLDDGYLDLAGGFVEMDGLANGIMPVVLVKGRHLKTLELTVYGGESWNGGEREWRIV